MGIFQVELEIGDPQGQHFETVDALVDSGATYTTLPESLLRRLGVVPLSRANFILADGSRMERGIGQTLDAAKGRRVHSTRRLWHGSHSTPVGSSNLRDFQAGDRSRKATADSR